MKVRRRKNYRCNECEQSFAAFKDFKKHKFEHQLKQDIFNCSKCDKTVNEDWKCPHETPQELSV